MARAGREQVLLALGSNIDPEPNLRSAVEALAACLEVEGVSRVYQSRAVGSPGAADFLNAAVSIATELSPAGLKLEILRPLERKMGRRRTVDRNAPRTIDLDIALFGDRVVENRQAGLLIPDPEIVSRAYLALPLADVAPELVHPIEGRTLGEIARQLETDAGVRLRPDLRLAAAAQRPEGSRGSR